MAVSVFSLDFHSFQTKAQGVFSALDQKGAGLARAIYKDALTQARFEPGVHGVSPRNGLVWAEHFDFNLPFSSHRLIVDPQVGGAAKVIWTLADGLEIESVLIPMPSREGTKASLCISSQVGCAMGCRFCKPVLWDLPGT